MEGGGENYWQDLQDFYWLKSPRFFPLAVLCSYYSWLLMHIHSHQEQGAVNPVIWPQSFVQRGAKEHWLSKLHHISGVFLINNSKPTLALMGRSSKGWEFPPLKILINFALFLWNMLDLYVTVSFLWWASRRRIAVCDMLQSCCHAPGAWTQNFHWSLIHALSECSLLVFRWTTYSSILLLGRSSWKQWPGESVFHDKWKPFLLTLFSRSSV